MSQTLLVVDDEPDIVTMLQQFFTGRGYTVLTACDGQAAVKQAGNRPDLILLDINMPGLDGLAVCRQIRQHVTAPILFLTARIEDADKIAGFAVGGDDYIIKPFSLLELEARVAAHLRRELRHRQECRVKFSGGLVIDYSQRTMDCAGQPIHLTKKEFDIVALLSQNTGQIFDKERIYERIWGYDSSGDSSVVAEQIRRIRNKIAAVTSERYIETVWGCGYKWLS